jgi:hypothetical protein
MKWVKICGEPNDVTEAMEVPGGVLLRTYSWYEQGVSEAMCFIPGTRIVGGCGERATIKEIK